MLIVVNRSERLRWVQAVTPPESDRDDEQVYEAWGKQACCTAVVIRSVRHVHRFFSRSPPVDIIWAMVIVWRIFGKIVATVLCCVVYDSRTQWYAHTWAVLNDECWFRFRFSFCVCLGLALCVFLAHCRLFDLVLFALVVVGLVSSVLLQETGWQEHLRNDLFCVEWNVKP